MSVETSQLDTPGWVAAILDEFEKSAYFDESEVQGRISAAAKNVDSPTEAEQKAANAECWAFSFYPAHPGDVSCWKTYFGPALVMGDFRSPDIAWIDPAIVKYWEMRMTTA